jgi:hypothetical protein
MYKEKGSHRICRYVNDEHGSGVYAAPAICMLSLSKLQDTVTKT